MTPYELMLQVLRNGTGAPSDMSQFEQAIADRVKNPHVFMARSPDGSVRLSPPFTGGTSYDLPKHITGSIYQDRTQKIQVFKLLQQTGNKSFSISSPENAMASALNAKMSFAMSDPNKFGFRLRRAMSEHLSNFSNSVNVIGGHYNFGEVALSSNTGILRLGNEFSAFKGANSIGFADTQFIKSMFSDKSNESVTSSYSAARKTYIENIASTLEMTSGGYKLTTVGIKDVGFNMMNGVLGIKLGVGNPDDIMFGGELAKFTIGGVHHRFRYLPVPIQDKLKEHEYFPILGGNRFKADFAEMKAMSGMTDVGTAMRSKVGYLFGPGAGKLWMDMAGDAGYVITNQGHIRGIAAATSQYKRYITGPMGMEGIPGGKTQLSNELLGIQEIQDILKNPDVRHIDLRSPITLKDKLLATLTGKDSREIQAANELDEIIGISRTSSGLTLHMRVTEKARRMWEATPILVGGVRGSARAGALMPGSGIDVLGYGGKFTDPLVSRERWLGHYASIVERLGGSSNADRLHNLTTFANKVGGLKVNVLKDGVYQLSATPDFYKVGNAFGFPNTNLSGATATAEAAAAHTRYMSEDFMAELGKMFGFDRDTSVQTFAPEIKSLDKNATIEQYMALGRMSRAEAEKAVNSIWQGNMGIAVFEENIQVRTNAIDANTGKIGAKSARLRAKGARNLLNKLDALFSSTNNATKKELLDKARGLVGSKISSIENNIMTVLTAMAAPIANDPETLMTQLLSNNKNIHKVSLKDLSPADKAEFKEIFRSLSKQGNLTPEQLKKITTFLGGEDSIGAFVDLGSEFNDVVVHSGATGGKMAHAARASNTVFIPNIGFISPEMTKHSLTGAAGDMMVIPRSVTMAGKNASEFGGLNPTSALFNALETVFTEGGNGGDLSKRIYLLNRSVREFLISRKGRIAKETIGVTGGRYNIGSLAGGRGFTVGMTEQAILNRFGKTSGQDIGIGSLLLERLKSGKDAYVIGERDPVLSNASSLIMKLQIISDKVADELVNNNKNLRGTGIHHTAFISKAASAMINADNDGDTAKFYLLNNRGKNFEMFQELSDIEYKERKPYVEALTDLLNKNYDKADEIAMKGVSSGAITADQLATILAGGADKVEELKNPGGGLSKMYREAMDLAADAPVSPAQIEATAAFIRKATNTHVGPVTAFAEKQQAALRTLTGQSDKYYNASPELLQEIANNVGIDPAKVSPFAESMYHKYVYGFLRKGSDKQKIATDFFDRLRSARHMDFKSPEYQSILDDSAKSLSAMADAVPQIGAAEFDFASESALRQAVKASSEGRMPIEYYRDLADLAFRVEAGRAQLDRRAKKTAQYMLHSTRNPKNFEGPVALAVTGTEHSFHTGMQGPQDVLDGLVDTMERYSQSETVERVAADAVTAEVDNTLGRRADLLKSMYSEAKGWGAMKYAALGAGALALYSMATGNSSEPRAPEVSIPESGMPATPIVGFPGDGGRPDFRAQKVDSAYIQRVPGQRTHFPEEDSFFMNAPTYGNIGTGRYQDNDLGTLDRPKKRGMVQRERR